MGKHRAVAYAANSRYHKSPHNRQAGSHPGSFAKERCPASGKRRFRNHLEAVTALHRAANQHKRAREANEES